jgi:hypothetical protein
MARTTTAFYVAYFESLIISVCGFVLLSGLLQGNSDYSSLQRWAVDAQFFFFCGTLLIQLLLSGIAKRVEVTTDLLSSVANAYCSLCFMIFSVCVLMFAQTSSGSSQIVEHKFINPNGAWYFHPQNCTYGTNGTWSNLRSSGAMCTMNTTVLTDAFKDFSNSSTSSHFFQSDRSDAVQMVFGNSYASSDSASAITTQSTTGSISFAFVLAFIAVTLFASCYAAYSSTAVGTYCPLFLSSRSLGACNGVIVLGIRNATHHVYGECGTWSSGVLDMVRA